MTEPTTIPIILDFCERKFGWLNWIMIVKNGVMFVVCEPGRKWLISLKPLTIYDGTHCISVGLYGTNEGEGGPYYSFEEVEDCIHRMLKKLGIVEDVQMSIFDVMT